MIIQMMNDHRIPFYFRILFIQILIFFISNSLHAKNEGTPKLADFKEVFSDTIGVQMDADRIYPLGFSKDGKFSYLHRFGSDCIRTNKPGKTYFVLRTAMPIDEEFHCIPGAITGMVVQDLVSDKRIPLRFAKAKKASNDDQVEIMEFSDIVKEAQLHSIVLIPRLQLKKFPFIAENRNRLDLDMIYSDVSGRKILSLKELETQNDALRGNASAHFWLVRNDGKKKKLGTVKTFSIFNTSIHPVGYILSPFESRAVVFIQKRNRIFETDFANTAILLGASLTEGFSK